MFKVGDMVKIIGKNPYCELIRKTINNQHLYIEEFRYMPANIATCNHNDERFDFYTDELVLHKKILEDV